MSGSQFPPFKGVELFMHILAWGILFGFPFFFTGRESPELTLVDYLRSIIVPISFMLVFYINYFILVDYYLFSKRFSQFIICNVLLVAMVLVSTHVLLHLLPPPAAFRPGPERKIQEIVGFFLINAMLYFLVCAFSVAIKMTLNWFQNESIRNELEKNMVEAELNNLKSQLNPHFLFNTLNNIYSLIAFSPDRAQKAVHDLSRLLRYVLYESSQPAVSLGKEENFIRNYVELMRIRLPEHVEVKTDISIERPEAAIAPLLFISLIENAFKHGVSNSKPSFIHIKIQQEENKVICSIKNSYFPKEEGRDKSGSGIGLQNLQRRLDLLYPGTHIFSTEQVGDTYCSLLVLDNV